jgi:Zn-dependent protease with chaperone function
VKQLRRLSIDITDSIILAERINSAMPIQGQPDFDWLQQMVDECASILDVQSPHVFVQQSGDANAHVTRIDKPQVLVVTSGLLDAYKDRPDELRFVIGHELGHLKADHVRAHLVGSNLVQLLLSGEGSWIKDNIVTPVLVWKLLEWNRAGEKTADRAGLLCVGYDKSDPDYALETSHQALLRLLHGTDRTVDPDMYMTSVVELERDAPFVKLARMLQSLNATHPFVSERVDVLEEWAASSEYQTLVSRSQPLPKNFSLVIDSVSIEGLPDADLIGSKTTRKCDPVISVSFGDQERKTRHFTNEPNPVVSELSWNFQYMPNGRMVVVVHDHDQMTTSDPVGEVLLEVNPNKTQIKGTIPFESAPGAEVTVDYRVVPSR